MLSLKRTPAVPFLATGACAPRVPPGRSDGSERLPEEKARAERVVTKTWAKVVFPFSARAFSSGMANLAAAIHRPIEVCWNRRHFE